MTDTNLWDRRRLLRGAVLSGSSVLVSLGIGTILTPLLLRKLGTESFGLFAVLIAVTGYLQLLEGGIGTSTVRRLAAARASGDELEVSRVITNGLALNVTGAVLAGIATLVTAPFASDILGASPERAGEAKLGFVVVGLGQCFILVGTSWTARTLAGGRADLLARRGIVVTCLSSGAQILVLTSGGGLLQVVIVTTVTGVVAALAVIPVSRIALPGGGSAFSFLHGRTARHLISDGIRQTGVAIAGTFSTGLDPILISVLLGPAAVAPYALASRGLSLLRAVATRAVDTLLAPFAGLQRLGDAERQYRLYRLATVGSGVLAVAGALPAVLFGSSLLQVWLGDHPSRTYGVLVALCLVLVVQIPGHVAYVTLSARGDYSLILRLATVAVPVNVALSAFFTKWLGPVGPAIGTLCVVCVADAYVLPRRVCQSLQRPVAPLLVDLARACLLPLLGVGAAAALLIWSLGAPVGLWSLTASAVCSVSELSASWLCVGAARRQELLGKSLRRNRLG